MKYSEQILQSWTKPLSDTEEQRAENTINMIRSAVGANSELRDLDYEIFTQGSFANNTNVRTESDVDVCVMLKSTFYYELPENKSASDFGIIPSTMTFQRYRDLIKKALQDKFGIQYVTDGNKSLKVKENTYHVQADVVPAFQYRNYQVPRGSSPYTEGTRFYAKDGTMITNYPKVHTANGNRKNVVTNKQYKALVRIMKHIKNDMVEDKNTNGDIVTSFLIECLVWNTPNNTIMGYSTWTKTVQETVGYLYDAIKNGRHKEWGEVSEMLYLFHPGRKWNDGNAKQWLYDAWNYLGF